MSEHPDPGTAPDAASDATSADPVTDPAPDDEVAAAMVGAFPGADAPDGDGEAAADVEGAAADADAEAAEAEDDPRTREELLVALNEVERQRDEYLDDLRRSRAEFENYRRRTGREAASARDAGRGDVASALLDVLDDLDRTLEAADGSSDPTLAKGVSLVADKLVTTLRGLGLARVEPTGETFDPALHEAVQQVPSEEATDEPVVESTLRPGYRLGDRVLRPAMVVVRG